MTTSKTYDNLNRLASISSALPAVVSSHSYDYNSANQRIKATLNDGSYWDYAYSSGIWGHVGDLGSHLDIRYLDARLRRICLRTGVNA